MRKAVIIPIKEPSRVKTRLSRLLSLDERQRLVWAMFTDVCNAVAGVKKTEAVFVVTSFDTAAEYAHTLGFDVLKENEQQSESASVDWASRLLRERGFDAVMRLPADVPLVQAEDIDSLLNVELSTPAALLVPSFEGTGTNAIIRAPADLFPSRFGPNSLALHTGEAVRAGVQCVIAYNENIALDIDEPGDIQLLLSKNKATQTSFLLKKINIEEKLLGLPPQYLLKFQGKLLGVLEKYDSNFPWIHCKFNATPVFEQFRPFFARQLEIFRQDEESEEVDWDTWSKNYENILQGGLRLIFVQTGNVITEFLLHIEGNEAWFRY